MKGGNLGDDFLSVVKGRTLQVFPGYATRAAKSGRVTTAIFRDVASGEHIAIGSASGSLWAGVLPDPTKPR